MVSILVATAKAKATLFRSILTNVNKWDKKLYAQLHVKGHPQFNSGFTYMASYEIFSFLLAINLWANLQSRTRREKKTILDRQIKVHRTKLLLNYANRKCDFTGSKFDSRTNFKYKATRVQFGT